MVTNKLTTTYKILIAHSFWKQYSIVAKGDGSGHVAKVQTSDPLLTNSVNLDKVFNF